MIYDAGAVSLVALLLVKDGTTMAVEHVAWPNAALLEQNRHRLMGELRAQMKRFEARYELPSSRLEDELKAGRLRETAEVCEWVMALHAYRALEHEQ